MSASEGVYLRSGMIMWVPYGYIPMVSTVSSLAVAIVLGRLAVTRVGSGTPGTRLGSSEVSSPESGINGAPESNQRQ